MAHLKKQMSTQNLFFLPKEMLLIVTPPTPPPEPKQNFLNESIFCGRLKEAVFNQKKNAFFLPRKSDFHPKQNISYTYRKKDFFELKKLTRAA